MAQTLLKERSQRVKGSAFGNPFLELLDIFLRTKGGRRYDAVAHRVGVNENIPEEFADVFDGFRLESCLVAGFGADGDLVFVGFEPGGDSFLGAAADGKPTAEGDRDGPEKGEEADLFEEGVFGEDEEAETGGRVDEGDVPVAGHVVQAGQSDDGGSA